MPYELLIAEKPSAAQRIAYSIAEGRVAVKTASSVRYYEIERHGKMIVVVPAVGHIFGLKQKSGGWTYPVYDVEWVPAFKISKKSAHTKNYYSAISALAKGASGFVVGTDFDIEGEVIAYNILRFACGKNDALRMKYSTLTKKELEDSFDNAKPHIEFGLAEAGTTRHILDYYFGINISRALTLAMKSAGKYKILSAGRVQGPTLKILADRELEIMAFVPKPFWQVELEAKDFTALYEKDRLWDESEAKNIAEKCRGQPATVSKLERKKLKHSPPAPFNLTDLQTESYRVFKIPPRMTQQIAQKLYEAALISYPRTSSQKLPASLNLRGILEKLKEQKDYEAIASAALKNPKIAPHEGEKTDDAHPAIHPTGERPGTLESGERKVYDLIVRRFVSTFGAPAIKESVNAEFMIDNYRFLAEGKTTIEPNWYLLYAPYSKQKEVELPEMSVGDIIDVKKINLLSKETEPPKRYTQASIIRKMESLKIGTKSTRAEIVHNLGERGYISGAAAIKVSDLGLKTSAILFQYLPDIVSVELTRRFEDEMEDIEKRKTTQKKVLSEAEEELTKDLRNFRAKEKEVGLKLLLALNQTKAAENVLGKCPACGKDLKVIVSKATNKRFVGCSGYSEGCRMSYPLPQLGKLVLTGTACKECGSPVVRLINKGRKPWQMCINPKCKTKDGWNKQKGANGNSNPAATNAESAKKN